jgi:hypothetical protein
MIWLVALISAGAICVLAGRAHSRYLDRLEARSKLQIQILDISPGPLTGAAVDHHGPNAVSVGNQMWICPQGIDEACLLTDEGQIIRTYDLRIPARSDAASSDRSGQDAPKKKDSRAA